MSGVTVADWIVRAIRGNYPRPWPACDPERSPRWPDPDHPQRSHLDLEVEDLDAAQAQVLAIGATLLFDGGTRHRVFAVPAGHPFRLYAGWGHAADAVPPRNRRPRLADASVRQSFLAGRGLGLGRPSTPCVRDAPMDAQRSAGPAMTAGA
ncbi:MAG TPA: VOC family protein [Micromonosporaceae bacterium]|nr:VOC family protein [Micromonosporaceae bacterium]